LNPDSAVKPKSAGSEAQSWSSGRRPTAKFQNDFAVYHAVAIKLKHPLKAALIDEHAERQKPVDFAAERLSIALSVSPNCGIRN
jgi:hypothetical protein